MGYVLLTFPEHNIDRRGVLFDKARKLVIDHYRANQRRPSGHSDAIFEENFYCKQNREALTHGEESILKASFFSEYPDINLTNAPKDVMWLHARYSFIYRKFLTKLATPFPRLGIGDWYCSLANVLLNTLTTKFKIHEELKTNTKVFGEKSRWAYCLLRQNPAKKDMDAIESMIAMERFKIQLREKKKQQTEAKKMNRLKGLSM